MRGLVGGVVMSNVTVRRSFLSDGGAVRGSAESGDDSRTTIGAAGPLGVRPASDIVGLVALAFAFALPLAFTFPLGVLVRGGIGQGDVFGAILFTRMQGR